MLVAPEMAGTAGEMRYNPTQYNTIQYNTMCFLLILMQPNNGACQTTHKFR